MRVAEHIGIVLGGVKSGGGLLPAPTLTWTSGTTVNTPTFSTVWPDVLMVDDVVYLQQAADSSFATGLVTYSHTITVADVIAGSYSYGNPALADGTYYFREKGTRAGVDITSWSNTVSKTIDAAPTLTLPTGVQTGNTTATVGATTDQANGTLYWVVTTASNTPSAAQVKAGQNHLGAAATASGNQTISSTGAKTASVTGLTAATIYYAHLMHEDSTAHQSNVVDSSSFTTTGTTYVGPGDVVSGAYAWASPARCYNAAYAGGALMDLVDQAGANPITIGSLSTGFVDAAAISSWVTAHSVSTIKVAKLYDQTGNGRHFTQATLANMPVLTLNLLNGLPGLTFAAGSAVLATASITLAQPFSLSAVWTRTANFTTGMTAIGAGSQAISIGPHSVASNGVSNAGVAIIQTGVTDNAWHAHNAAFNNTSSGAMIDGADTGTVAGGTNTFSGALRIGRSNGGTTMSGSVTEAGLWPSAFNSTQRGNINTNQHSTNGYNF